MEISSLEIACENTKQEVLDILKDLEYSPTKDMGRRNYNNGNFSIEGPHDKIELLPSIVEYMRRKGSKVYEDYNPQIFMNVDEFQREYLSADSKGKLKDLVKRLKRPIMDLQLEEDGDLVTLSDL